MWLAGVAVEFDHVLAGLLPAGSDGGVLESPTMIVLSLIHISEPTRPKR